MQIRGDTATSDASHAKWRWRRVPQMNLQNDSQRCAKKTANARNRCRDSYRRELAQINRSSRARNDDITKTRCSSARRYAVEKEVKKYANISSQRFMTQPTMSNHENDASKPDMLIMKRKQENPESKYRKVNLCSKSIENA